ncbi:thrombopoietin receptor isoform X2 [Heteronotia binoei]|uniref:thrombopoietin receptor isoform X2 n=1 Tax=Heteronotia binoei TaxID=13085 RepID=UPI0029318400|nr:thrombopoietin receptor isoform X2 [Heteronotia binoei]
MATSVRSREPLTLLAILLLTFWPMLSSVFITDEEAALLAESPKDIFCFSRTFEDLICFWNEPEMQVDREYHFFYAYKGEQHRECKLTSERQSDGSWRHICIFPSDHKSIKLFIELYVEVLDSITNDTILSQKLSVETVGLISPPENITAEWPRVARQLHVTWDPPHLSYVEFLAYEVLYGIEDSWQPPSRIEVSNSHMCCLSDLLPGQQYHIQVRTKPDGLSLDGLWGPWSPSVLAETPHLPGEIGLHCFTPDLHQLHCQWDLENTEPGPSHSILSWAEDNSSSTRTQTWHKCEEEEERIKPHYSHTSFHICTFQPNNRSAISVLVIVTQGQSKKEVNYFKEPFDLHQVVLTAPPRILQPNVGKGILKLEWVTPLEALEEHMVYQIRYAVQGSLKWKVLHVQYSTNCEILDLITGSHYCLQLRTQPDGQKYQGFWSAWSNAECIEIPPGSGSTVLTVAITLLFCAGLVLGVGCTCISTYSVRQKLWPPIPDLQHVLDGFLEDNSKQDQQVNAFFCNKNLENTPCPLEVLSEMSLDIRSYSPLPDVTDQMEWDNQLSSYQHYMVLSPSSTQEVNQENEYFDGTQDASDTFPMPLEHGSHADSNLKVHLSSFTLCRIPHSPSEMKEEISAEVSGEQYTSPTHISNQSYLLMG